MILEFIGFFVVFGSGACFAYWILKELYFFLRYQFSYPIEKNDIVSVLMLIVLACVGAVMMFYGADNAPFTFTLDFNLKN